MENRIEIEIPASVPTWRWQKEAIRLAREAVKAAGIKFTDADIFVTLPEPGRAFVKAPGYEQFSAIG